MDVVSSQDAITMLAGMAGIVTAGVGGVGAIARVVVTNVRITTTELGGEIKQLTATVAELRNEMREVRQTQSEHSKAIAVLEAAPSSRPRRRRQ